MFCFCFIYAFVFFTFSSPLVLITMRIKNKCFFFYGKALTNHFFLMAQSIGFEKRVIAIICMLSYMNYLLKPLNVERLAV
ncbi:uncharacterized protein B0P05DRAFT_565777 [Gilbertella persicaria]|uniref:uncharacterized protein n=1 Tax=Gilbertella persicaria TaxID=101096 RepID=UPI00221F0794|nr:uncharacterized protein B0P05DRAFT_565777 [Gilbertella persicaria]KAI8047513.1 hypothetical protein B0P05DRAFT_565777 [Gilbertella persicaria]